MKYLHLLLWLLLAAGCGPKDNIHGNSAHMTRHYIGKYLEADSIWYWDGTASNSLPSVQKIYFEFRGKRITYRDSDKERFRYYYTLYGDSTYNQERDLLAGADVIVNQWQSVTITYDGEYDAGHPAGSSLNDLVQISYESPYTYIRNGYQQNGLTYDEVFWKRKLLSEITPEDMLLINNYIVLEFLSPLDTPATGRFTMTWTSATRTVTSVFSQKQD